MAVNITRSGIERLELVDSDGDRLAVSVDDELATFEARHRRIDNGIVVVNATADELREFAAGLSELADQLDPDS